MENKMEIVEYKTNNGVAVKLDEQVVRTLTNNNENITNDEVKLFIALCQNQRLNPLIREAYLVKYDKNKPAQQIVSVGAFQRIAEDNPQYDGMEDGVIVKSGDKVIKRQGTMVYQGEVLLGGWAKVYRKDRRVPTVVELNLKEYAKGQSTWNSMPSTMINKCARVGALRNAFPNAFNNCYADSEIQNGNLDTSNDYEETISVEDVNISTKKTVEVRADDTSTEIIVEDLETLPDEQMFTEEEVVEVMTLEAEREQPKPEVKLPEGAKEITYKEYYNNKNKYTALKDTYREEMSADGTYTRKFITVVEK